MQAFFTPQTLSQWHMWFGAGIALLVAAILALVGHAILFLLARRMAKRTSTAVDDVMVAQVRRPTRVMFVCMAVLLTLPTLPLLPHGLAFLRHLATLGVIASTTWAFVALINAVNDFALTTYRLEVSDNLLARQFHTRFRLLRHVAFILLGILAGSSTLMTFPSVRQLGVSLLASAGLTGLVIGMAARSTLSNLLAGVQLAFAEPIRIDDVVLVEGEWGWIEDLTMTYVVVRIWDLRRLVVPLSYFIERPFQNWTRVSADLLGAVSIYADYTVPVDAMRQELLAILKASDLWDGKVWGLQMTNATEHTVELRALMSARDSGTAWNLRCDVREKLIAWLQEYHPMSLPRVRTDLNGEAPRGAKIDS